MENFIFSLNATIPVFLVILLGYILKKLHLINEEFVNVTNKYVFKVALTRLKPAVIASAIKLIALPALFIPIAVKLGFAGSELVAILIMLASPTTVTCYIMAKAMQNDEVLTSNVVVITTLLSSVTLTLWVFILKSCALI
ncbi:MAG: hypothetical protein E7295_04380 [Lachnospiraceae bacterium]|nr:hypothetical protein [Lachnospiraceae bacterium]